jgi:hypothetical protein
VQAKEGRKLENFLRMLGVETEQLETEAAIENCHLAIELSKSRLMFSIAMRRCMYLIRAWWSFRPTGGGAPPPPTPAHRAGPPETLPPKGFTKYYFLVICARQRVTSNNLANEFLAVSVKRSSTRIRDRLCAPALQALHNPLTQLHIRPHHPPHTHSLTCIHPQP